MNPKGRIVFLDEAPTSRGGHHLRAYWAGERLARGAAILAKCCECMGYYRDGRVDCHVPACPLYGFMPYRDDRRGQSPPENVASDSLRGGPGAVSAEELAEPVPG